MATKFNFSKTEIAKLAVPVGRKRDIYQDEKVRGLYLYVTQSGHKAFYCVRRVGPKAEQIRLGAFPDMTVEWARRETEALNARIAKGENPAEARRAKRAEPTFEELFDWWFENHVLARGRAEAYRMELLRQRKTYLKEFLSVKAPDLTRTLVREWHTRLGKTAPYVANRSLATIRAVFNKAIAHERINCANPAVGIEAHQEYERERRLLPGEVGKFLEAVAAEPDPDIRDLVLLALFTGARRSQVMEMRWDALDLEARTWFVRKTKNGNQQILPLEDQEIEILKARHANRGRGPWVFPGQGATGHLINPNKGWDRIRKAAGMEDLRLHDLRRTFGSFMADAGVSLNVIGGALNHLSPSATKIYARLAIDTVRKGKIAGLKEMLSKAPNW